MNLLIVDDNAINLKLLHAQLEAEGHAVLEAADGVQALAVLEREPVDGIVSDILMPRMDGYRLCQEIRQHPEWTALPVILYSSTYDSDADRQLAMSLGADAFIIKPAPTAVILEALHEATQNAAEPKRPPSPNPDGAHVLQQYNKVLVEKLEERNTALQESLEKLRVAHEALRVSEEKFRGLFESSRDAIMTLDILSRRFTSANPAALRMFGVKNVEELSSLRPCNLSPERQPDGRVSAERARELIDTAIREGSQFFEWRHRRINGEEFAADVLLTRMELGENVMLQSTVRDITQRKRAEEEIHTLNAELEQRVAKRTRQLAEANEELESFSYSVSHDLRAPLRHVHGYVELLKAETAGQLSPQAREHLKTISDASVEMGQLIDDLLDFSRMARTDMLVDSVRLDELAQESVRGLELVTRDRNIVWKIAPLPAVQGDRAMLRRVFANLVGNSVKYTRPRDPAEVEIGCAGEEDGRAVCFVRDNGVGFNMKYLAKLFGVFQRLHKASEFEGTGTGLAIVKRIIHRHGGRVWAESAPNQGATFYFSLKPAAPEPATTERKQNL